MENIRSSTSSDSIRTKAAIHDVRNTIATIKAISSTKSVDQKETQKQPVIDAALKRIEQILIDSTQSTVRPAMRPTAKKAPRVIEIFDYIATNHLQRLSMEFGVTLRLALAHATTAIDLGRLESPHLFLRALENVIQNAAQAAAKSKKSCACPMVLLSVDKPTQDTITIKVSDNGNGIPPEVMANPKLGKSIGKQGGSGIGLRFVHSVLEQMGGRVQFHSDSSVGATVTLTMGVKK